MKRYWAHLPRPFFLPLPGPAGSTIAPPPNEYFNKNEISYDMATHHLLLLPGDGIGVETIAEVERVIAFFNETSKAPLRPKPTWSAVLPMTRTA